MTLVQDKSIKIESSVEAFPKAKIQWFLNDKELTQKDNVKIETDPKSPACNLSIPKLASNHSGVYKIKATNTVGSSEHVFNINVQGKYR